MPGPWLWSSERVNFLAAGVAVVFGIANLFLGSRRMFCNDPDGNNGGINASDLAHSDLEANALSAVPDKRSRD